MRRFGPVLLAALVVLACRRPPAVDPTYLAAVDTARARRVSELTSEDGWLSLVARELLAPGENVVGSDSSAAVVLEAPGIPAKACVFDLRPA